MIKQSYFKASNFRQARQMAGFDTIASLTERFPDWSERRLGKSRGWMEQQHVEMDGLCDFFPEDVKDLLSIYSNMDSDRRAMLLEISRTVKTYTGTD